MEINIGATYEVKISGGGRFMAKATGLEQDGTIVVLTPTREPVRDVFPSGYRLGSALWNDCLVEHTPQ